MVTHASVVGTAQHASGYSCVPISSQLGQLSLHSVAYVDMQVYINLSHCAFHVLALTLRSIYLHKPY